jgi:transcriptional regulator with XRE-family HTH domain
METKKDRLNKVIKDLGISKNEFARKIDISAPLISKITTQEVNFGIEVLEKIILAYPSLNHVWFLTGVGEMWIKNQALQPSPSPSLSNKSYILDSLDISEDELVKILKFKIKQVSFLYQRLVDVRILLDEEANIKKQYSTDIEAELLWDLARPSHVKDSQNKEKCYKYELHSYNGKIIINRELDNCIKAFNETFFKEFKDLYLFLRTKRGTI